MERGAVGKRPLSASSGRVFPKTSRASPRFAWLRRRDAAGVQFAFRPPLERWDERGRLRFNPEGRASSRPAHRARARRRKLAGWVPIAC